MNMLSTLGHRIVAVLRDEKGIETLEWVAIGGLVVAVALVVYTGILQPVLVGAVQAIGTMITPT